MCGDFNAEPDSDEMRYLRGLTGLGGKTVYFADCHAATRDRAGTQDPGFTFDRRNPFAAVAPRTSLRVASTTSMCAAPTVACAASR